MTEFLPSATPLTRDDFSGVRYAAQYLRLLAVRCGDSYEGSQRAYAYKSASAQLIAELEEAEKRVVAEGGD